MRIALVGATGFIGSKILAEAVHRGHLVTAISRHPENALKHEGVRAIKAEVGNTATLATHFHNHDAIIHAYAPPRDPIVVALINAAVAAGDHGLRTLSNYIPKNGAAHDASVKARIDAQTTATHSIIQAAKTAKVRRILAVGGAGSLLIKGTRCLDLPDFPKAYEGGAKSTAIVKEMLKEDPDLEWTVLCPSTVIAPGERTGKYRLGLDDLLVAPDGSSTISVEDYAAAMIDELEVPRHTRHRFTVGY